jgi:hypothetical protein
MRRDNAENQRIEEASACEASRRFVLDLNWGEDQRRRAADALRHIENCEACRAATSDFDRLRELLSEPMGAATDNPDCDRIDVGRVNAPRRITSRGFRAIAAAVTIAIIGASALWAVVHGYRVNRVVIAPPTTNSSNDTIAPLAASDVANRVAAFEQVNDALDRRAGWMLVSDSASDVGLDPASATDEHRLLLVRLTLSRHGAGAGAGGAPQVLSLADLAIRPGRKAALSLPLADGRELHYELAAGASDPVRLALWAELRPGSTSRETNQMSGAAEREPLAALATTLDLRSGASTRVGALVTVSGQYEVSLAFSSAKLSAVAGAAGAP